MNAFSKSAAEALGWHREQDDQSTALRLMIQYKWALPIILIAVLCIFTRIRTGAQAKAEASKRHTAGPRTVPVQPYWIPWIGHAVSMGLSYMPTLMSFSRQNKSRIFALKAAGYTINIVTSPSLTRQVLDRPGIPVDSEEMIWYMLETIWNDGGENRRHFKENPDSTFWTPLLKPVTGMLRDPWLSQATGALANALSTRTYNLVSGNESWVDQAPWERVSRTEIVSHGEDDKGDYFVAQVDLFELLRDWIGQIATELLMGRAFLENNPQFLADLWLFDRGLTKFLLGLPSFLVPGLLPVAGARRRLIQAISEHHEAMNKISKGQDPGTKYDGMNDVSSVISGRVDALNQVQAKPHTYGVDNLAIVWAMNANANSTIFWMIWYLYSDAELLSKVRTEIAPYVRVREDSSGFRTGGGIRAPPSLDMDVSSICTKCHLLKSTYYETMRHEVSSTAFRRVTGDFVITESEEDARVAGKTHPDSYLLKKGESIIVPSEVHQRDEDYWANAERFDPYRFMSTPGSPPSDPTEKTEPQVSAKTLRAFGGGKTMCKGRVFAEREVLLFVASIVTGWEMAPVATATGTDTDRWNHPGRISSSAATLPKGNTRVRMWRRRV